MRLARADWPLIHEAGTEMYRTGAVETGEHQFS